MTEASGQSRAHHQSCWDSQSKTLRFQQGTVALYACVSLLWPVISQIMSQVISAMSRPHSPALTRSLPPMHVLTLLPQRSPKLKIRQQWVAFVSGLDLSPSGDVRITYGSADEDARLLTLSLTELEGMFTGGEVQFNKYDVPYPVWTPKSTNRSL